MTKEERTKENKTSLYSNTQDSLFLHLFKFSDLWFTKYLDLSKVAFANFSTIQINNICYPLYSCDIFFIITHFKMVSLPNSCLIFHIYVERIVLQHSTNLIRSDSTCSLRNIFYIFLTRKYQFSSIITDITILVFLPGDKTDCRCDKWWLKSRWIGHYLKKIDNGRQCFIS